MNVATVDAVWTVFIFIAIYSGCSIVVGLLFIGLQTDWYKRKDYSFITSVFIILTIMSVGLLLLSLFSLHTVYRLSGS